jgi:DNA polymerase-3 subunit alpha
MSSSLTIDEIIDFSLQNNCKYASLIDINTMFGTMEFYNKCKMHNLTPIIGVQYKDFVLIPKDNSGFKNLIKISSFINTNAGFNLAD